MRLRALTATLAMLLLAGGVAAGQAGSDTADDEAAATAPRARIRVLEDPYDLASFYRSSDGAGYGYGFFGYDRDGGLRATDRYPIAGYYRDGDLSATERYPIAGYYRSSEGGSYGYWRAQRWGRSPLLLRQQRRRRTALPPGQLYLLVPTFLAPVLPLADEAVEPVAEPEER